MRVAFGWADGCSFRFAMAGAAALHIAALSSVVVGSTSRDSAASAARTSSREHELPIETVEDEVSIAEQPRAVAAALAEAKPSTSSQSSAKLGSAAARARLAPSRAPEPDLAESSDDSAAAGTTTDDGGVETTVADGEGAPARGLPSAGDDRGSVSEPLAHGPSLLGTETACQRYFPFSAQAREASVTLAVYVGPRGEPYGARIIEEQPSRDGFGSAAKSCALNALRFSPAVDRHGSPAPGTSILQLRFVRRDHRS